MSNDDTILQQIQDLTVAGAGGAPLPFEQAPPRVVSVPYTSTAVMNGTDVQYQFGPDAAKFVRESDLRPLDNVRFPSSQGQLQAMRRFEYKGNLLVDEKNQLARPQYDVRSEPLGLLRSLGSNASRLSILNTLYQKGFYSSGKPSSNGMSGQDQNAMANLLEYANAMGRTYNVALLEVQSFENERGLGGAASVRVTAKEDLQTVLREESFRQLGRPMTPQEVRDAVQFIQSRERQAAMGGVEQAPALSTLTTQAVTRGRESEVQVEGFRTLADLIERALGGS